MVCVKRTSTFAGPFSWLNWAGLPPKKLRMSAGIVRRNGTSTVMEATECTANEETALNEQRVTWTSNLTRVSNEENREVATARAVG